MDSNSEAELLELTPEDIELAIKNKKNGIYNDDTKLMNRNAPYRK
jgi:hypothetical protein